ncbi:hypothetical protein AB6A40_008206 [Gnathostoma spinigerum]|uniref:Uncharacterized protein n=1 Tax=Gnathostoma spinigerum TaxID=75299 RepID=A0ABD6EXS8_9BILA
MEEQFLRDVRFLGCVLRKDWNGAVVLLSNGPVGGSTKNICFSFLEDSSTEAESKAHENVPKNEILGADIRHRLLDMLKSSELKGDSTPLSSRVLDKLKAVQDEEEAKEIKKQIDTFKEWSRKRMDLIKSQTERLSLRLRQEDILKEKAELQKKIERIHFFENRLKWEDEARRRDTLFKELKMKEKDTEKSEDEYRSSLFEITRKT